MIRTVHRIWVGGPEPEWLQGFAETWKRPGWELRQWTDENVSELFPLRNQAIYDRAEEICPKNAGQLRADVLRYELLHREGGMYVDADFECLRPIDRLIEGFDCFAAWEAQGRWIANGFMGAIKGHPFLAGLIDGLEASIAANPRGRPNRITGPQYLTAMWRKHGRGGKVKVLDQKFFYPFSWSDIEHWHPGEVDPAEKWPGIYACHWWANMRRERNVSPV